MGLLKYLSNRILVKGLCLLALLLLLLPSPSSAGATPPAPPAPPAPAAHPHPPTPPPDAPGAPRGWLGVFLSDDEEEGVTVTGVKGESPADKAGLQEGDQILEMDGQKIERSRDIRRAMRNLEPGDTVQIKIKRKSQEKTLTATLGKPPERGLFGPGARWFGEDSEGALDYERALELGFGGASRNYLGVRVLSLTEDLRAYFKAPRGRGILVSRVEDGTPAAKAGLRAGDVIIAVDGKGVSDQSDIAEALSDHEPGDKIPVKIVREGTERTVDVEIGERPGPRRRGAVSLPDGEELDLKPMEALPPEAEEMVRESLRNAHEEIRRAMSEAPDRHAQISAALHQLSGHQMESIHRQVEEAMKQARDAVRRVAESMGDHSI